MRVALLVLLAGCDVVWNIDHVHDAAIDAPDAAPEIDAPPTCVTFDLTPNADVVMYATAGSQQQGHPTEAIMTIGMPIMGESLQRFPLPILDAGFQVVALHLHEPFVMKANGCNGNCGLCSPIDQSGTFAVEFATSQWAELDACYAYPTAGGTWAQIGATGAADRSAVVGTAMYTAMTDLDVDLDPTQVAPWLQSEGLSVIVSGANAQAKVVLGQKDFASFAPPCTPVPPPATLHVKACRN